MSTSTVRWGLTIPLPCSLPEHRPLLEQLHGVGYSDVWSAEGGAYDAITPLALAAAWTPQLRFGTGVVSAYTRGPAVLAWTAIAMTEIAPSGFLLGIGSSSDVIVRDWNAIDFQRPLHRTRDVVRFLRRAFTGEKVTAEFDTFSIRNFRLPSAPTVSPRIVVAALREKMLRMAAREADGVMLNWLSAGDARKLCALVREESDDAEIIDRIMVYESDDADAVYSAMKPLVASYSAVGVYRAFHRWLGRGEMLADSWAAWDAGDRKAAVRLVPDSVVDELVVHGDAQRCRTRLSERVAAGVTTPVIAWMRPDMPTLETLAALLPREAMPDSSG